MNVIYGVPVVPKTLKLSLDQPEQSNETFSQIICENVFESFHNLNYHLTDSNYKLNYWLNQNFKKNYRSAI